MCAKEEEGEENQQRKCHIILFIYRHQMFRFPLDRMLFPCCCSLWDGLSAFPTKKGREMLCKCGRQANPINKQNIRHLDREIEEAEGQ